MIVGTEDGVFSALAILVAAVITVLIPILWSQRRTRTRIGKPNGGGSVVGEIAIVQHQLDKFVGEVHERFRSTDERLAHMDHGLDDVRDGQIKVSDAVAQLTATVDELNALHRLPNGEPK